MSGILPEIIGLTQTSVTLKVQIIHNNSTVSALAYRLQYHKVGNTEWVQNVNEEIAGDGHSKDLFNKSHFPNKPRRGKSGNQWIEWINGTDMHIRTRPQGSQHTAAGYHATQSGLQGCSAYEMRVVPVVFYENAIYLGPASQPLYFNTPCK